MKYTKEMYALDWNKMEKRTLLIGVRGIQSRHTPLVSSKLLQTGFSETKGRRQQNDQKSTNLTWQDDVGRKIRFVLSEEQWICQSIFTFYKLPGLDTFIPQILQLRNTPLVSD